MDEELKVSFSLVDADRGGVISKLEFGKLIAASRGKPAESIMMMVRDAFNKDHGRDKLSQTEFIRMFTAARAGKDVYMTLKQPPSETDRSDAKPPDFHPDDKRLSRPVIVIPSVDTTAYVVPGSSNKL